MRPPLDCRLVTHAAVTEARPRSLAGVLGDYLSLLKPRVVLLLVLTALGAMLPAAHGHPSIDAVIARTGVGADSVWFPGYSVAAARTRKV